ncbi:unnamed protein product [Vitrella brassicaformis CCMP3155]|uniref:Uncharacterized protein n=1 Tax=Vitrella brassicaformis (strain CCMP3155) TaxID=1169540 RepID=A0A0G4E8Y3_VITBC|nr:unnamed protein product [Vitrella brassicaformis CCMP3155]|eukprot:CEL91657.1 unnamed protein product [Vitrella brassicaformis CCMP3155]
MKHTPMMNHNRHQRSPSLPPPALPKLNLKKVHEERDRNYPPDQVAAAAAAALGLDAAGKGGSSSASSASDGDDECCRDMAAVAAPTTHKRQDTDRQDSDDDDFDADDRLIYTGESTARYYMRKYDDVKNRYDAIKDMYDHQGKTIAQLRSHLAAAVENKTKLLADKYAAAAKAADEWFKLEHVLRTTIGKQQRELDMANAKIQEAERNKATDAGGTVSPGARPAPSAEQFQELVTELQSLQQVCAAQRADLENLRSECQNYKSLYEWRVRDLGATQQRVREVQGALEQSEKDRLEIRQKHVEAGEKVERARVERENKAAKTRLVQYKKDRINSMTEISTLKNQLVVSEQERENLLIQIKSKIELERRVHVLEAENQAKAREHEHLMKQLALAEARKDQIPLEKHQSILQDRLTSLHSQHQSAVRMLKDRFDLQVKEKIREAEERKQSEFSATLSQIRRGVQAGLEAACDEEIRQRKTAQEEADRLRAAITKLEEQNLENIRQRKALASTLEEASANLTKVHSILQDERARREQCVERLKRADMECTSSSFQIQHVEETAPPPAPPAPNPAQMPFPLPACPYHESGPTYGETYKQWELERQVPMPRGARIAQPDNRDFGSTYRTSFKQHEMARRPKCPMDHLPTPPVPPDTRSLGAGTSMYKQEYTHKEVPRTQAVVQPPRPYALLKFEGTSTHKADYQQWELPPPRRPQAVNEPVSLPFQGASTYKNDFDREALPDKPHAEKMEWTPNPAKFEALSSYRESYDEKPVCKAQSVKPVVQAPPPLPFEGTST